MDKDMKKAKRAALKKIDFCQFLLGFMNCIQGLVRISNRIKFYFLKLF